MTATSTRTLVHAPTSMVGSTDKLVHIGIHSSGPLISVPPIENNSKGRRKRLIRQAVGRLLVERGPCHFGELRTVLCEHNQEWDPSEVHHVIKEMEAGEIVALPKLSNSPKEAIFLSKSGVDYDEVHLQRKRRLHSCYLDATQNKDLTGHYAERLFAQEIAECFKLIQMEGMVKRRIYPFKILCCSKNLHEQKAFFLRHGLEYLGYVDLIVEFCHPHTNETIFGVIEIKNRGQWEYWQKNDDLQRFIQLAKDANAHGLPMVFAFIARRIHWSAKRRLKQSDILYHETYRQHFHPDADPKLLEAKEKLGLTYIEIGPGSKKLIARRHQFVKDALFEAFACWRAKPSELSVCQPVRDLD